MSTPNRPQCFTPAYGRSLAMPSFGYAVSGSAAVTQTAARQYARADHREWENYLPSSPPLIKNAVRRKNPLGSATPRFTRGRVLPREKLSPMQLSLLVNSSKAASVFNYRQFLLGRSESANRPLPRRAAGPPGAVTRTPGRRRRPGGAFTPQDSQPKPRPTSRLSRSSGTRSVPPAGSIPAFHAGLMSGHAYGTPRTRGVPTPRRTAALRAAQGAQALPSAHSA
jgi:hypothetical protein